MVAVRQLVKIHKRPRPQMWFHPCENRSGAGVQVRVDVDDELIVLRRLIVRQRVVEPAHDIRHPGIFYGRRASGAESPDTTTPRAPVFGQSFETVEPDEP